MNTVEAQLEQAYQRLSDYDSWTGEFEKCGCEDADETQLIWNLKGQITMLQRILSGARASDLISDLLDHVQEITNPEEEAS